MNIDKIGKFISERRKLKKLTQEQLAEKLNISDRAISKWERGICLPDASTMIPLCKILDISVNELLSGEMIKEKNDKTDELLVELSKREEEKDKLIFISMYIIIFTSLILFLIICLLAATFMKEGPLQLVVILFATAVLFIACFYALKLEASVGYYECKKCHHKHKASYKEILWAVHMGTTRYLRCPNCNEKSWSKKVLSK
jgi:transcriptional regulator with XRE-family HTH domain